MNELKSTALGVGLLCVIMSLIGLPYLNYIYFFHPERRGTNGEVACVILNGLCIFTLILGIYLLKFGSRNKD